jgi:hypothetical protein
MTTPKNSSVYATFPSTYYIHRRRNPQTISKTRDNLGSKSLSYDA